MTRLSLFLFLGAILSLSACSTIYDGATQEITVETPGADEAYCYLDNGKVKYRIKPPETFMITNSESDLTVNCRADGWREKTVVFEKHRAPSSGFNALNLFVPGEFIDSHSGALYKYPDLIVVDFRDMPPQPADVPNYLKLIEKNPEIHGMEEFRPGLPALQRDWNDPVRKLQRRSFGDEDAQNETFKVIQGEPVGNDVGTTPTASTADGLIKQMNPQVFDGSSSSSVPEPVYPSDSGAPINLITPPQ